MIDLPSPVKGGVVMTQSHCAPGEGVSGQLVALEESKKSVSADSMGSLDFQNDSGSEAVGDVGPEDGCEMFSSPPVPRPAVAYSVRAVDLSCSICFEPFEAPFVTKCGHTFCYECVQRHLVVNSNCPTCKEWLVPDQVYPNKRLQEVLKWATPSGAADHRTPLQRIQAVLEDESQSLSLPEIEQLLSTVVEKKQCLEEQEKEFNYGLVQRFMERAMEEKERQLVKLQQELHLLGTDLRIVNARDKASSRKLLLPAASPIRGQGSHALALSSDSQPSTSGVVKEPEAVSVQEQGLQKGKRPSNIGTTGHTESKQEHGASASQGGRAYFKVNAYRLWAVKRKKQIEPPAAPQSGECQLPEPSSPQSRPYSCDADVQGRPEDEAIRDGSDAETSDSSSSDCSDSDDMLEEDEMGSDVEDNPRRGRAVRPKRKVSQFEDLHSVYLSLRCSKRRGTSAHETPVDGVPGSSSVQDTCGREGLAEFGKVLKVYSQCSKLEVVARLEWGRQQPTGAILSSIEFSKDSCMFATAGVKKTIALYDFDALISNPSVESHCPKKELRTLSKLSCLSWNKFVRRHLISSDYEGGVQLWDVENDVPIQEYQAHEKRIWSVDYSSTEHMQFVSGSDDGMVKTWDSRSNLVGAEIYVKANVCSVKYNPTSHMEIAVACADHNVHFFDIRNKNCPIYVLPGHGKAVSYVKYMDSQSLVSASTDSTLRLWDVPSQRLTRVYRSHVNEKNFVGLSVEGDFIACGSETGEVFVYHRHVSEAIASVEFDPQQARVDGPLFMTAVCWKPNSRYLLAANCTGLIRIMKLGPGNNTWRGWS